MKYFLDTNICIYFLKNTFSNIKIELAAHKPGDIKIASVVKAELLFGAKKSQNQKKNRQKIDTFLSPFKVIPFSDNETETYALIRVQLEKEGSPIGANDMLIAATVIANNGTLITNNEKEFKKINGLKTQNWTKAKP